MRPEEARKLVGGFATGTLSAEERRLLLEAALDDQEIFNELAREQALLYLLDDPGARRRLLDALEKKPPAAAALRDWLRRPIAWAAAGSLAAAAVALMVMARQPGATPPAPEPVLTAKLEHPPSAPATFEEPEKAAAAHGAATPGRTDSPGAKLAAAPQAAELAAQTAAGAATPQDEPAAAQSPSQKRQVFTGAQPLAAQDERRAVEADSLPFPLVFRLLRADAGGNFEEVAASTVFDRDDRIRVRFEPSRSGRLRVEAGPPETLLDQEVDSGAAVTIDVPPGAARLTGAFRAIPLEIRIQRRPQ